MTTYRKVKLANLIIGAMCFGLEMYAFTNTTPALLTDVDSILVLVSSFSLVESVFGILLCNKKEDCCCFTLWKYCWFVVLASMGGALIIEAFGHANAGIPTCSSLYNQEHVRCHFFQMKVAAGIMCLLNGIVYLFATPDPGVRRRTTVLTAPPPRSRSQGVPRMPSTTTIITSGTNAAIVNIDARNIPRPREAPTATAQGPRRLPRPQAIPLHTRPLPIVPHGFEPISSPFAPSAPPPPYFDCPPPYSTLPPNVQRPQGDEKC